jgi:hypothetical protein
MFTRFVTKVLGFRRRIAELLGYTGGESLEQIAISDQIKDLPIQPCSLWAPKEGEAQIWGDEEIIRDLPPELKREPGRYIEDLPLLGSSRTGVMFTSYGERWQGFTQMRPCTNSGPLRT